MIGQPIVPIGQDLQRQRRGHEGVGKNELLGLFRDRNRDCSPRHCGHAGMRSFRYSAASKPVSPRWRRRRGLSPALLDRQSPATLMGAALKILAVDDGPSIATSLHFVFERPRYRSAKVCRHLIVAALIPYGGVSACFYASQDES